jgi:hypothetical protein
VGLKQKPVRRETFPADVYRDHVVRRLVAPYIWAPGTARARAHEELWIRLLDNMQLTYQKGTWSISTKRADANGR